MSEGLPFEQMFGFERSAIRLDDGTFFQPLREATHRFKPSGADAPLRMTGSYFEVIYVTNDGGYIYVEASCPYPLDTAELYRVIPTQGQTTGRRITANDVVRFLVENELEVPDALQVRLTQLSEPYKERDPLPLSHWNDPRAMVSVQKGASTQNVTELLRKIHRFAIDAIHEIEDWGDTDVDLRQCKLTVHLAWRLLDRYKVEHGTWWGQPDSVPPKSVDILRLRWPAGLREVGQRVIKTLRHQVMEAACVLNGHESGGFFPTRAERELAQVTLLKNLDVIRKQIADLGKLLADSDSGKLAAELNDKAKDKVKIPLPWRVKAWRLSQSGLTGQEIAKRVRKDEGNVSRAIAEVTVFYGRFGYLPDEKPRKKRAQNMDPTTLEMRSKSAKKKSSTEEE